MKYTILDSINGGDGAWFQIHKHGCSEVARFEATHICNGHWTAEAESSKALVAAEIADLNGDHGEGSFGPEHFRIMPCTKGC